MAHPYGDTDHIERIFRTLKSRRPSFGSASTNDMSTADRTAFIEEVDDWIDYKLKIHYSIPLTNTGADAGIITQISDYESCYRIWTSIFMANQTGEEVPDAVTNWHQYALGLLDDIIKKAEDGSSYLAGETLTTTDILGEAYIMSGHTESIYDEDITLNKDTWTEFEHQVVSETEEVYNRTTSTLTADGYIVGSTKYTKDTDYEIIYQAIGRLTLIRRKTTGSITDGQTVRVKKYLALMNIDRDAEGSLGASPREDYV